MNTKHIKECLDGLYTDMLMLEDGSWEPDRHSIGASIESIIFIASELNLIVEDTRDEPTI